MIHKIFNQNTTYKYYNLKCLFKISKHTSGFLCRLLFLLLLMSNISSFLRQMLWMAGFWHQHHMRLFTDMSVIDQYFINQSIGLANNMTYMREARLLSARLVSISKRLSFPPSAELDIGNICSSNELFPCMESLDDWSLICKSVYCRPVRQLGSPGIHLHIKQDIWKNGDLPSEVMTWFTFGAVKSSPNIGEKPNSKLVPELLPSAVRGFFRLTAAAFDSTLAPQKLSQEIRLHPYKPHPTYYNQSLLTQFFFNWFPVELSCALAWYQRSGLPEK